MAHEVRGGLTDQAPSEIARRVTHLMVADHSGSAVRLTEELAVSGDTLAVGSVRESSAATGINGNQADNSAMHGGAAYVFQCQ